MKLFFNVVEFAYNSGIFDREVASTISQGSIVLFDDGPLSTISLAFTNVCGGCNFVGNLTATGPTTPCLAIAAFLYQEGGDSSYTMEPYGVVLKQNGDNDAWGMDNTFNRFEADEAAAITTGFNLESNDFEVVWSITSKNTAELTYTSGSPMHEEVVVDRSEYPVGVSFTRLIVGNQVQTVKAIVE